MSVLHKAQAEAAGEFRCGLCTKSYAEMTNLKAHYSQDHGI